MENKTNKLPFHDMRANLLIDGKYQEEEIAVKNVWHKGVNVFLDIYIYSLDKNIIIDSLYIREIEDLETGKLYNSSKEFIDDFLNYKYDKTSKFSGNKDDDNAKALDALHDDVVVLMFLANGDFGVIDVKVQSIQDYVIRTSPKTKTLGDGFIKKYIQSIEPNVDDFYEALENIKNKSSKEASKLFMEAAKVCSSDGYINYEERVYLAEIMQSFKENNISLKDCIM